MNKKELMEKMREAFRRHYSYVPKEIEVSEEVYLELLRILKENESSTTKPEVE